MSLLAGDFDSGVPDDTCKDDDAAEDLKRNRDFLK